MFAFIAKRKQPVVIVENALGMFAAKKVVQEVHAQRVNEMFLGGFQLGTRVNIILQCTDADKLASMPVAAPLMRVRDSANAIVMSKPIPLLDKSIQVGLFAYHILLDDTFSVGAYTVDLFYTVGAKNGIESHNFSILPGGHSDGCALGMAWYHRPHANFVVYQVETGRILKGKNPRIS